MAPITVVVVPTGHSEQNDEPETGANEPISQLVHLVDPLTGEKKPAAHGTQSGPHVY